MSKVQNARLLKFGVGPPPELYCIVVQYSKGRYWDRDVWYVWQDGLFNWAGKLFFLERARGDGRSDHASRKRFFVVQVARRVPVGLQAENSWQFVDHEDSGCGEVSVY